MSSRARPAPGAAPEDGAARPALLAYLRARGADRFSHAHGRSLLDHLVETRAIIRRWRQPEWLQDAALLHSVYATDAYRRQLIPLSERDEVATQAGVDAERMAFLFAAVSRGALFDWVACEERIPPAPIELPCRPGIAQRSAMLAPADVGHLLLLHTANHAEQASDRAGGPDLWLAGAAARLRRLDPAAFTVPAPFTASIAEDDERAALALYRAGLDRLDDPPAARRALSDAAAHNPWVGEPCAWLALLELRSGRPARARCEAARARERFDALGVAWDKRQDFERWLASAHAVERIGASAAAPRPPRRSAPEALPPRLQTYLTTLVEQSGDPAARVYPGLRAQPWHDPARFPIAAALGAACADIRGEVDACEAAVYQRESENIRRTGSWDVLMLYERGRRNDAVCEACPVTAAIVESEGSLLTQAGLAYVSRLRPGTHIAAHRGPTNLRVRCHLGLHVPPGDCAIRVAGEVRGWAEGACLVFDDFLEHEAWNATAADRIVLVVDLWHPDLSAREIRYLSGLHRYAMAHARSLQRYWAANDRARSGLYH